jgi:nucleoside-diphosphate-sugar epimerase
MTRVRPESEAEGDYRSSDGVGRRVVVTGAGGFIGSHVLARFRAAGCEVVGIVRPGAGAGPRVEGVRFIERDLAAVPSLADVLREGDTVVHLAARAHRIVDDAADPLDAFRTANVEPVRMLCASAAEARIRRLMFISSAKVFGEGRTAPYTVGDRPAPADAYAQSKWEAEQVIRATAKDGAFTWTILRPPFVYGPGGKGNFPRLFALARMTARVPLPLGGISNLRSMLFVGNLADAIYTCAFSEAAANQTYLPTDGRDVSTPELLRTIAKVRGDRSLLFSVPLGMLRGPARLLGRSAEISRLTESLRLDPRQLREDLDWHPPFTLEDGLAISIGARGWKESEGVDA